MNVWGWGLVVTFWLILTSEVRLCEIVRDCAVKDEKICKMHLQQTRSMPDLMSDGKKLKLEME